MAKMNAFVLNGLGSLLLVLLLVVADLPAGGQALQEGQQRASVVRRVVKVGPGARLRMLGARAAPSGELGAVERGAVAEISSKEAASFGQRSLSEAEAKSKTAASTPASTPAPAAIQTSSSSTQAATTTSPSASSTTAAPSTTTAAAPSASTQAKPDPAPKQSGERQQSGPQEVELLSSAPTSWQSMMAVEAPAAMLVGLETAPSSDTASVDPERGLLETVPATGDFLRGATKGTQVVSHAFNSESRQNHSKMSQQTFFYPAQPARVTSKTSGVKGGKTHWYQPPTSTTTTPRPAPLVQEYEQEQFQQQVEYGPAPLGEAEPFAFDFKTLDSGGNGQYRKEESDKNGVVRGSYGYTDASGIYRHVEYIADQNGFRANIKSNEPGLIGETQPASIQFSGPEATQASQRFSAPSRSDNSDWIPETLPNNGASNNDQAVASSGFAMASPDFESSHKPERIRSPRNYRN